MSFMYAMQRANGDWFGLDDWGRLRVPVFRSQSEAMQARSRNFQMLLFKPVMLDELALSDLSTTEAEESVCFWMVDNPSAKLKYGRPLEHAQLAVMVRNAARQMEQ